MYSPKSFFRILFGFSVIFVFFWSIFVNTATVYDNTMSFIVTTTVFYLVAFFVFLSLFYIGGYILLFLKSNKETKNTYDYIKNL